MTRVEQRLRDALLIAPPDLAGIAFEIVASRAQHRRRVLRSLSAAAAVACAVLVATIYLTVPHHGGGSQTVTTLNTGTVHGSPVPLVRVTVTIDPSVHEVFSPPSSSQLADGPRLTAVQALATFASRTAGADPTIPASVTVQLGSLTLVDHATNRLAYGYRGPEGRCAGNGALTRGGTPGRCVRWTFLDANTGRLLDSTQQALP